MSLRVAWHPSALSLSIALAVGAAACRESDREPERGHPTVPFVEETASTLSADYKTPYEFSDDWFTHRTPEWKMALAPFVGQPDIRYLEIGVFEGRSFFWVLENVLTHPTSRLTAVDIFIPAEVEARFMANVERSGQSQRITTIKGTSQTELRKLPLESFDVIYVDGSHTAEDVMADAVLGWGLLKTGGVMIFDDFPWDGSYYTGPGSHLPPELLPGMAINAFMQAYRSYFEIVHQGYQVMLEKRANPCPNKSICSPIGEYTYDWKDKTLLRVSSSTPVELSEDERRLLEQIFWNRRLKDGQFVLKGSMQGDPAIQALLDRLGLDSRFADPPRG